MVAWLASRSIAYPLAIAGIPPIMFGIFGENPLPEGAVTVGLGAAAALAIAIAAQRGAEIPPPHVVAGPPLVLSVLLFFVLVVRQPVLPETNYGEIKTAFFLVANLVFLVGGIYVGWSAERLRILFMGLLVVSVGGAVLLVLHVAAGGSQSVLPVPVTFSEADHSISMGRQMTVGVLVALALVLGRGDSAQRLFAAASLPLLVTALIASGSRGPMVALIGGLAVILTLGRHQSGRPPPDGDGHGRRRRRGLRSVDIGPGIEPRAVVLLRHDGHRGDIERAHGHVAPVLADHHRGHQPRHRHRGLRRREPPDGLSAQPAAGSRGGARNRRGSPRAVLHRLFHLADAGGVSDVGPDGARRDRGRTRAVHRRAHQRDDLLRPPHELGAVDVGGGGRRAGGAGWRAPAMRIAYVGRWSDDPPDGVCLKVEAQADEWMRRGHDVRLFGLPLVSYGSDGISLGAVARSAAATARMRRAVERFEPDVVYVRYGIFLPALRALQRRFTNLVELNARPGMERASFGGLARRALDEVGGEALIRRADGLVCVAHAIARDVERFALPTRVIANGARLDGVTVEPAHVQERPLAAWLGGVQVPGHGLDKLLDLARATPEWDFALIGVATDALPAPASPNVRILPRMTREDYSRILARADVGIGPLAMHRAGLDEASPLKVREYLAHGVPVGHRVPRHRPQTDPWFLLRLPNVEENVRDGAGAPRVRGGQSGPDGWPGRRSRTWTSRRRRRRGWSSSPKSPREAANDRREGCPGHAEPAAARDEPHAPGHVHGGEPAGSTTASAGSASSAASADAAVIAAA